MILDDWVYKHIGNILNVWVNTVIPFQWMNLVWRQLSKEDITSHWGDVLQIHTVCLGQELKEYHPAFKKLFAQLLFKHTEFGSGTQDKCD